MRKAGRFTSALLLIAVGAAVIVDQYAGTAWTERLIEWWPLLFIALGLEYIWFNSRFKESDKALKLDLAGLIFAVIISAVVVVSMRSELWMHNGWSHFTQEKSYEQGMTELPVPDELERIVLTNPAGDVTIRTGDSDRIVIHSTVQVGFGDESQAEELAEQSRVESETAGNTLTIKTVSPDRDHFWGMRKVRMNLIVTLPERAQRTARLTLDLSNGSITAEQLKLAKEFKGTTTNGAIRLTEVEAAELDFQSTNAKIRTEKTKGKLKLQTTNGSIEAEEHEGDLRLKSTNGQLTAAKVSGAIAAETTNGEIRLDDTRSVVEARTTNGSIEVNGAAVAGDWSLHTTHGKIDVALPGNGDFQIEGQGQSVSNHSTLPLRIFGKEIEGKIGTGKYQIKLDTNGSLAIRSSI